MKKKTPISIFKGILFFLILGLQPWIQNPLNALDEENKLKAIYILKFLDYIDWNTNETDPFNTLNYPRSITLGVQGNDPFLDYLKTISIHSPRKSRTLTFCNAPLSPLPNSLASPRILFLSQPNGAFQPLQINHPNSNSDSSKINPIPTLIITDLPPSLVPKAHIRFFREENKVLFFIDPELMESSPFKMSSRLLKLSHPLP